MAILTLRQTATQVGVSRQTIYRLVKEGKLSATVGDDGQKVVDTAELLRTFGRLTPATGETVTPETVPLQRETAAATGQTGPTPVLRAQSEEERRHDYLIADREAARAELAAAKATIARLETAMDEYRERERKHLELLAGQTRLLEHKAIAEAPPRRGFWRRLTGR